MPRFMVSAVPIIPMARSMLLQILAAYRGLTRKRKGQFYCVSVCVYIMRRLGDNMKYRM